MQKRKKEKRDLNRPIAPPEFVGASYFCTFSPLVNTINVRDLTFGARNHYARAAESLDRVSGRRLAKRAFLAN